MERRTTSQRRDSSRALTHTGRDKFLPALRRKLASNYDRARHREATRRNSMKNDNGAVLIRTTPNTNQVRLSTSLPAGRLDITRLTNRRELEQVIEYRLAEM